MSAQTEAQRLQKKLIYRKKRADRDWMQQRAARARIWRAEQKVKDAKIAAAVERAKAMEASA